MAAEVMREYLVSLGFRVDPASEARFRRGLDEMNAAVMRLGAAVSVAAVGLSVGVLRMSRSLESLYYTSQRTGASVGHLRAFSHAIEQMGGTASDAIESVEGIARAMRDNPGIRGFVRSLVPTADLNDALGTLEALGRRWAGMPYHIARLEAQMVGVTETVMRAAMRGTEQYQARYREFARRMGVNSEQSARAAVEFQRSMRDLGIVGELAMQRLVIALAPIAPQIVQFAERTVAWLDRVIPQIDGVVRATVGWDAALTALGIGIVAIGAGITLHLLAPLVAVARTLRLIAAFAMPVWALRLLGLGAAGLAAGALAYEAIRPTPGNEHEEADLERFRRGEPLAPAPRTGIGGWWERNAPSWLGGGAPAAPATPPGPTSEAPRRQRSDPEFAAEFGPAAERVAQRLGVSASSVLAHWSLETHNGRAFAGANNLGNMTALPSQAATEGGDRDAAGNPIRQRFRNFTNFDEFAAAYASWVERRAPGAMGTGGNALAYGSALSAAGYATHREFASGLAGAARRFQGVGGTGQAQAAQPASQPLSPSVLSMLSELRQAAPGSQPIFARGSASEPLFNRNLAPTSAPASMAINQRTEINIRSSGGPRETAEAVQRASEGVNAGLVRQMQGAVQ